MALATADIHVKVDPVIKKRAEKKFKADGITMSDFINIKLRSYLRGEHVLTDRERRELPENLRIDNREQLIAYISNALEKDDGTRYTESEARQYFREKYGVKL